MTETVTAILLILGTATPIVGGIALAATEHLGSVSSGPEDSSVNLVVRRWTFRMASIAMLLALFGFALLSTPLRDADEETLSTVALVGFLLAAIGWLLEMTVTSSVGEVAAKDAAKTGAVPGYWEPIRHWVNVSLQQVYVTVGLIALALYGRLLLITGLTPAWAAWTTIGMSIFWFVLAIIFALVLKVEDALFIPAVLLLPPVVIGVGTLVNSWAGGTVPWRSERNSVTDNVVAELEAAHIPEA
ncbi:MAG: hypothetical protein V3W33_03815 [Gammaproteobacteria bacterium]